MIDDRTFTELAHRLGHDLMSPLSGIAMLLTAAQNDPAGLAPDGCAAALAGAQRAIGLVRAFVAYADAGQLLSMHPVDTAALVAECARAAPAGAVRWTDLPVVTADGDALRRVFAALIDNGVRYGRTGEPALTVRATAQDGGWRFEVADRGPGLDAAERARALQPLVRGHAYADIPGHGLGLATCARILNAHGGALGLDARPGGGTIAWFTLPAR